MEANRRGFLSLLTAAHPAAAELFKEIPEVETIQQAKLDDPDSLYILTCPENISTDTFQRIVDAWKAGFERHGVKAPPTVLLSGGLTVQKIRLSDLPKVLLPAK